MSTKYVCIGWKQLHQFPQILEYVRISTSRSTEIQRFSDCDIFHVIFERNPNNSRKQRIFIMSTCTIEVFYKQSSKIIKFQWHEGKIHQLSTASERRICSGALFPPVRRTGAARFTQTRIFKCEKQRAPFINFLPKIEVRAATRNLSLVPLTVAEISAFELLATFSSVCFNIFQNLQPVRPFSLHPIQSLDTLSGWLRLVIYLKCILMTPLLGDSE